MTDFQHWPNLFHIGCVYLIKMELYETQLINLSKNNKKVTDIDTGWNSQPLLHRRSRINSIVLKRAFLNINFKRFLHNKSSTQYIESQRICITFHFVYCYVYIDHSNIMKQYTSFSCISNPIKKNNKKRHRS